MRRPSLAWPTFAMIAALASATAAEARNGRAHYTIVIDRMAFGPAPSGLHVGDTIMWVNRDMFRHSATAADRSFDLDLPPGGSGRMTLMRAGAIAFSCKFHPGMKGVLVVAP